MAMTMCRKCQKDVSSKAETCPNCGVNNPGLKNPGQKTSGFHKGCFSLILFVFFCMFLSAMMQNNDKKTTDSSSSTKTIKPKKEVLYHIIDSSIRPGIKRTLDVRLEKKVSKKALRAIALELKSQDSRDYKKTFITYYLPYLPKRIGQEVAWASTHFSPDLKVKIRGLTSEEEKKLVAEPLPADSLIIGSWLIEDGFINSRTTIFRKNGKLFVEDMFKDGSTYKQEVVEEKKLLLGRRFKPVKHSKSGDYWVILSSDGRLQIHDLLGLINTGNKLE